MIDSLPSIADEFVYVLHFLFDVLALISHHAHGYSYFHQHHFRFMSFGLKLNSEKYLYWCCPWWQSCIKNWWLELYYKKIFWDLRSGVWRKSFLNTSSTPKRFWWTLIQRLEISTRILFVRINVSFIATTNRQLKDYPISGEVLTFSVE